MTSQEVQANIQARLRELMEKKQWSQSEVSRRTGIPQGHISRMLSGEFNVSLDNLIKLCVGTNHSLDYMTRFKLRSNNGESGT